LNAQPNGTVTFPIVSNNTAQGVLDKSEVVFDSSNWTIPQEVTILAQDNGNTNIVNYTITAGPSTADPAIDLPFTLNNNALTLHARNTSPGFDLSSASGTTGEWGKRASFTFRLTSPPSANVTCYYYIDNESEGRSITGTVDNSFAISNLVRRFTRSTSNWGSNATITVEGVDDELIDGNQTFNVVFLPCSSADTDYDGLIPPSVQFINEDND
jgi:large repetitive protein